MSAKDALKVIVLLLLAASAVAVYCYVRVDIGMSQEEANKTLEQWVGKIWMLNVLVWSQLLVAGLAWLGYQIWCHRSKTTGSK